MVEYSPISDMLKVRTIFKKTKDKRQKTKDKRNKTQENPPVSGRLGWVFEDKSQT